MEPIPSPVLGTRDIPGRAKLGGYQQAGPGATHRPARPSPSLQLPLKDIPGKCPERQGPTLQACPSHLLPGSPSSASKGPKCPPPALSWLLLPSQGALLCGAAFTNHTGSCVPTAEGPLNLGWPGAGDDRVGSGLSRSTAGPHGLAQRVGGLGPFLWQISSGHLLYRVCVRCWGHGGDRAPCPRGALGVGHRGLQTTRQSGAPTHGVPGGPGLGLGRNGCPLGFSSALAVPRCCSAAAASRVLPGGTGDPGPDRQLRAERHREPEPTRRLGWHGGPRGLA